MNELYDDCPFDADELTAQAEALYATCDHDDDDFDAWVEAQECEDDEWADEWADEWWADMGLPD